jgi:hypothetical protein
MGLPAALWRRARKIHDAHRVIAQLGYKQALSRHIDSQMIDAALTWPREILASNVSGASAPHVVAARIAAAAQAAIAMREITAP